MIDCGTRSAPGDWGQISGIFPGSRHVRPDRPGRHRGLPIPTRPLPRPAERFAPGALLAGRYRIVAALGKGGMGEVYRADDLTLGQSVALKFLPAELAHDPERLARFHAEVRIARQVSHPNVCRVYDIGEADGQPFLTMEYIDGEDLAALLRRIGRLPEEKGDRARPAALPGPGGGPRARA